MEPSSSPETQPRPGLIACFKTGFDTVANHIWVIIIPIAIDLILWLGPHVRLKGIVEEASASMQDLLQQQGNISPDMLQAYQAMWGVVAERMNLITFIRTLPVGVPSLMSGRFPLETPFGNPLFIEMTSAANIAIVLAGAIFIGIVMGAFYYLLIAQLAENGSIDWGSAFQSWPKMFLRSLGLALLLVLLVGLITVPFMCFLGMLAIVGVGVSSIGTLVYGVILAWWMFPLLFSAHGIFLYGEKIAISVRRSIRLTRQAFPLTGLLVVLILIFAEGLDFLWNTPSESSWLLLLGIAGHAFITTAMLATSFIYYKEMNRIIWGTR